MGINEEWWGRICSCGNQNKGNRGPTDCTEARIENGKRERRQRVEEGMEMRAERGRGQKVQ